MTNNEIPFWIAITQLPRWGTERINRLIVRIIQENNSSLEEFFNLSEDEWMVIYGLSPLEISDLTATKRELPNYSFLSEDLLAQGFEVITINLPEYSKTLKENLKLKFSPPILHIKGNKQILQEKSIAIVGSRDASVISLQFADNIARLASKEFKVIVSGFAKGIDKQALDSSLIYKGQSIIVLPQGVLTFGSGIKQYYKQIVEGDVLVLSTFFPKAPWSANLAMARNPIIYGLAKDIYVAQSSDKGGTWSGVIDGIRKGRQIYVRYPETREDNANLQLIEKGAIPVDMDGNVLTDTTYEITNQAEKKDETESLILSVLQSYELDAKQILEKTKLNWTEAKMRSYLNKMKDIEKISSKPVKFKVRNAEDDGTLFKIENQ